LIVLDQGVKEINDECFGGRLPKLTIVYNKKHSRSWGLEVTDEKNVLLCSLRVCCRSVRAIVRKNTVKESGCG
jgi:hypothetical protein